MHALVLQENLSLPNFQKWPDPEQQPGEVVVELKAAALNHRDVFIIQGEYPGIQVPIILGSDGAGLIEDRPVLLNPALYWGEDPRVQSETFQVLGLPRHGTFAEKIAIPEEYVYHKPEHLSWEAAAALPLAGLTAYRALFTHGQLTPGQRVLISGVGGGVALMAFQFALAAGAEVWVTSGSEEKLERAGAMGAKGGINYRRDDFRKYTQRLAGGGFDLIIDSAAGPGFTDLVRLVEPAGRLVSYGGTKGPVPNFLLQHLMWRQIAIIGSTMGNDQEFRDMLQLVSQHRIEPVVDSIFPLGEAPKAMERMEAGQQFGKIVFKIEN